MNNRLSILAGEGQLVPAVLVAAKEQNLNVQLLKLTGRSDLEQWNPIQVTISKPLSILMKLRGFKPRQICMVGGVQISDKQREGMLGVFRKKKSRQRSTGDTGMSRLVGALELATGAKVIGVHEIVPGLIAPTGIIAGPQIDVQAEEDCAYAIEIAHKIGLLDVGQAIVSSGLRILAVEDIAGTDALLMRIQKFTEQGMTGNGRDPLILTKIKKPNQPTTTDLPAIGPQTLKLASNAGVSIICIEANSTLLIEKAEIIALAKKLNITIFGLEART